VTRLAVSFIVVLSFFGIIGCGTIPQAESCWQRGSKGLAVEEGCAYYENLSQHGLAFWSEAKDTYPGRKLTEKEQTKLNSLIKNITFPIARERFWRKTGYRNYEFRPSLHSLTTGILWETYWINDTCQLVIRTLFDDRKNVELIYDGAVIIKMK